MRNGFSIFDTHIHLGTARHSGRSATADEMLRAMDEHGVDRALAMPFPVVADYHCEHDLIGRAVIDHPDRFTGAACHFFRKDRRRGNEGTVDRPMDVHHTGWARAE